MHRELAREVSDAAQIVGYDGSEITAVAGVRLQRVVGDKNKATVGGDGDGDGDGDDSHTSRNSTTTTTTTTTKPARWDPLHANAVFSSAAAVHAHHHSGTGSNGPAPQDDGDHANFSDLEAALLEADNRYSLERKDLALLRHQVLAEQHVSTTTTTTADGRDSGSGRDSERGKHFPSIAPGADVVVSRQLFMAFMRALVQARRAQAEALDAGRQLSVDIGVTGDDFGRLAVWQLPSAPHHQPLATAAACAGRLHCLEVVQLPNTHRVLRGEPSAVAARIVALDAESSTLFQWVCVVRRSDPGATTAFSISWRAADEATARVTQQPTTAKRWRARLPRRRGYHGASKEAPVDQMLSLGLKPTAAEKPLVVRSHGGGGAAAAAVETVQLQRVFGRSHRGFCGPSVFVDADGAVLYLSLIHI